MIYINNEPIGQLYMGESYVIKLPVGRYKFYMKLDFSISESFEFEIEEGKSEYFTTNTMGNFNNPFAIFRVFTRKHLITLKERLELKDFPIEEYLLKESLSKYSSDSVLALNSKKRIVIKKTLISPEGSKEIFSSIVNFPEKLNYVDYCLSKRKRSFSMVLLVVIILALLCGVKLSFRSIILQIILMLVIFALFRPLYSK